LGSRTYLKYYTDQNISLLRDNLAECYLHEESTGFLFKNKGQVVKITCKLYNEEVEKNLYSIHSKYNFDGFW